MWRKDFSLFLVHKTSIQTNLHISHLALEDTDVHGTFIYNVMIVKASLSAQEVVGLKFNLTGERSSEPDKACCSSGSPQLCSQGRWACSENDSLFSRNSCGTLSRKLIFVSRSSPGFYNETNVNQNKCQSKTEKYRMKPCL